MSITGHHATHYTSSGEATVAGKRKEMEARASAIASVCVLLLLATPLPGQQVAAGEFCACYRECFPGCRHHVPRFGCMLFCANKCSPRQSQASNAAAAGGLCRAGCTGMRICGLSESEPSADAAFCAQNCNEKWSHGPTK